MIKIQKRLSVLLVWLRRKWEKINCRLSLISLLIHIFPIKLRNRLCRVIIFWPSPLQWICREWVKKLGSDEATTCFEGEKHTESSGPTSQGEGTPRSRTGMRQPLLIMQDPPSYFWAFPSFRWSLLLFIHLFRSSSSYTCQSSMPILKCTSPQPFFLALCELLWPTSPCPGVTSTSKGVRVLVVCI